MSARSGALVAAGVALAVVVAVGGGIASYGYGHSAGVHAVAAATPRSLTTSQLKSELDKPQIFIEKDWSSDWTRTFDYKQVSDTDECTLAFADVDSLAGLTGVVERELDEESTGHQVNQSVGYTPHASAVVEAEKQSLASCGPAERFSSDKGTDVTFEISPIAPSTLGIPASDPALCSTEKSISTDDTWSFEGEYCTIAIGYHVLQVNEISNDPASPVTRIGFESIVRAESSDVVHG